MSSETDLLKFIKKEEMERSEECIDLINKIRKLDEGQSNAWNRSTREYYRRQLLTAWIMKNALKEALVAYKYTGTIPKFDNIKETLDLFKLRSEVDQCINKK